MATKGLASRTIGLSVIAAAGLALLAPTAQGSRCPGAGAHMHRGTGPTLQNATLCLLNQVRARHGMAPLEANPALATAARQHARDMVRRGYFSHSTLRGAGIGDRVRSTGYIRPGRWLVGENIGWGIGPLSTPGAMVHQWLRSPPHRANILRSAFRDVGIGIVRGSPAQRGGGATFVTDFGRIG